MKGILTYHSIDSSDSPISIDEEAFRRHVEWLASGNVAVRALTDLAGGRADEDAVAVTFDDGFVNFDTAAWPLLREHRIPVTLFIATDHAGRTNGWFNPAAIPTLPLLGWEALGRLAAEGVEIGSHSCSHTDLRRLAEQPLADELDRAAERIRAEVGRLPTSFAYPYGDHDDRVVAAVRKRHALACTAELRLVGPGEDPCRLPRLDAYYFRRGDRLAGWGSARFRAYLGVRTAARRLRRRINP